MATDVLGLYGIDELLTDTERDLRDTVRRYGAERLRPHIAGWYADGRMPARDLAVELGALGLLGMRLTGYGCAGAGAVAYGLACAELEAVDSGLRSLVSVQGSLAMHAIHTFGSEQHKQRWLPEMAAGRAIGCFGLTEPEHGSDPASMRTRAHRDGGDWLLTGTKTWITNAPIADVAVVWARTDDGIRGFVVPTDAPGVAVAEIGAKLSLRASATGEISLDDVRLPDAAMLPGAGGMSGPLRCLTEARLGIAFGVTGAARDCLDTTIGYATTRHQFGKPIAGFQLTQHKLVDASLALGNAVLLALHLGRRAEAGTLRPELVSAGKLNNVRAALAIARDCRTILGAAGITLDFSPLRHANNLESVLTYEGTSEIHTLILGQALTGLSAFH